MERDLKAGFWEKSGGIGMVIMIAFGWASVMLLLGVFLRGKVKFLQNMLVPAGVIAGVLGLVLLNIFDAVGINIGADVSDFNQIVSQVFIVSFISLTLMDTPKKAVEGSEEEKNAAASKAKSVIRGGLFIGLVWTLLYALTPLICTAIALVCGKTFDMAPIYGMLIQFAFCQGPGQSATYGGIIESYGWENAVMMALTFSSIGFLMAYVVGIPVAKYAIKKRIAKYSDKIDEITLRGYYKLEEQTETTKKNTTVNSNIETLALHFAVIGVCYLLAVGISKILTLLPGYLGPSLSSLMFLNGMYAAYIVKFIMKKLGIMYFLDSTTQNKITGFAADYLVVCAFMSVSLKMVVQWTVPIIIMSVVSTLVTFAVCFYFGERYGTSYDIERTLGYYGMAVGTAPSGISLIRIVDPDFKTGAAEELGASNPFCNIFNIPVYLLILGFAAGSFSLQMTVGGLAALTVAYLVGLKVTGCWGKKKTYSLFEAKEDKILASEKKSGMTEMVSAK